MLFLSYFQQALLWLTAHALLYTYVRYEEDYDNPDRRHWQELKAFMRSRLSPDSMKTIWKFLCYAEKFLNKGFTIPWNHESNGAKNWRFAT
jgi:hypothetical protein